MTFREDVGKILRGAMIIRVDMSLQNAGKENKDDLINLNLALTAIEKLHKEEVDKELETICHEVSKVYCNLTNNKFSKANTKAEVIIAEVEEQQTKHIEDNYISREVVERDYVPRPSKDAMLLDLKGWLRADHDLDEVAPNVLRGNFTKGYGYETMASSAMEWIKLHYLTPQEALERAEKAIKEDFQALNGHSNLATLCYSLRKEFGGEK